MYPYFPRKAYITNVWVFGVILLVKNLSYILSTFEDDFQILLNEGDLGDQLLLTLTCTDTRASYVTTLDLFVGEPSWTFMTDIPEAGDDAVGGYHFDILLFVIARCNYTD